MVIDTNVLISILFEPNEAKKVFLTQNVLIAPTILKIEFINVLRKVHFLEGLPMESVKKYFHNGLTYISDFKHDDDLLEIAIDISFKLNHPIYDCLFLALAHTIGHPFVSLDARLLQKAKNLGIETLEFSSI